MTGTADAIIIGGGCIGLSTAYQLAKQKFGKIIVLEKEMFLGTGATAKCAGGIRAQFTTKINVQMSMISEEMLVRFEEDTGYPLVFDQNGYMFLLFNDTQVKTFGKSIEMQKSLGLPVDFISPEEISEIAPAVKNDDVLKATFCKNDGIADPGDMISGYSGIARKLGVEIITEAEVTGIKMSGSKVSGVITANGEIASPLVVNCAGPYAKTIAKMAKVDIPIEPVRRQIVTTGKLDYIEHSFPMVVDTNSGLYFHRESPGLLLGWADPDVKPAIDESVDPDYTDNILMKALDRIPRLETAEIAKSWAGLYEITPDHHAIIGWEKKAEGMFYVGGFSGHGMMHAPAAGLVSAEIICGKEPTIDISALAPDRFEKGELTNETNVI